MSCLFAGGLFNSVSNLATPFQISHFDANPHLCTSAPLLTQSILFRLWCKHFVSVSSPCSPFPISSIDSSAFPHCAISESPMFWRLASVRIKSISILVESFSSFADLIRLKQFCSFPFPFSAAVSILNHSDSSSSQLPISNLVRLAGMLFSCTQFESVASHSNRVYSKSSHCDLFPFRVVADAFNAHPNQICAAPIRFELIYSAPFWRLSNLFQIQSIIQFPIIASLFQAISGLFYSVSLPGHSKSIRSIPFRATLCFSVAIHLCSIVNAASAPKIRTAMSCTNFVRQPRKQRTVRLMPLSDNSFAMSSKVYFLPVKLPSRFSAK